MKKIPVLIDVDTGIDDAMALVIACASDKLDILGVTTVAGLSLIHMGAAALPHDQLAGQFHL